jgi:hypothetical protein
MRPPSLRTRSEILSHSTFASLSLLPPNKKNKVKKKKIQKKVIPLFFLDLKTKGYLGGVPMRLETPGLDADEEATDKFCLSFPVLEDQQQQNKKGKNLC